MLASDEKPVQILNELILINNDRIEGYNYALKETEVDVLKVLFSRLTETSDICRQELAGEIYKLGGEPAGGIHQTGVVAETWREVKQALIYKDHLSLLKTCEKEESVVISFYENFLSEEDIITNQQLRLLNRQYELLNADHEKVKNLLGVLQRAC
jgi:uncharacterized protein (TIGR02284 family)